MGNQPGKAQAKTPKRNLKNQIDKANLTGVLDLSNKNLDSLPAEILQLKPKLKQLNLSNNALNETCLNILVQLENLTKLNLSNNKFSNISPVLCNLKKLKHLDASFNKIETLPRSDHKFLPSGQPSLNHLNLKNNLISNFNSHDVIYSSLSYLDLSYNRLQSIQTGPNLNCHNLLELNLEHNINLSGIVSAESSALFDKNFTISFPAVKVLRVNYCQNLKYQDFDVDFFKNSKVSKLYLENIPNINEKTFKEVEGYEFYDQRRTDMEKMKD